MFILASCGSGSNTSNSNEIAYTSSAWLKGSNTANQHGVYGTKGQESISNALGVRVDSVSWIDSNGNMWLFGGIGYAENERGRLNDLWFYSK
ncbi:MAG: hypothetical protein PHC75_02365 [Burkholderiales bacterium]|nr:hypothetical protein [Burkholderiales bacterium]